MQYPRRMATLGLEAVMEFYRTERKPEKPLGPCYHHMGVPLVTDQPGCVAVS